MNSFGTCRKCGEPYVAWVIRIIAAVVLVHCSKCGHALAGPDGAP